MILRIINTASFWNLCLKEHQPEFTILEWYRCGFTLEQLMQEVGELLQSVMPTAAPVWVSYAELCKRYLKIDI